VEEKNGVHVEIICEKKSNWFSRRALQVWSILIFSAAYLPWYALRTECSLRKDPGTATHVNGEFLLRCLTPSM
jgi:hypothetical protein